MLAEIAAAAIKAGIASIGSGGSGGGGNSWGGGSGSGFPGRATGGPVAPGAAYLVGERGPELFVPTSSGRVVADAAGGGRTRDVRVSITIAAPAGGDGGGAAPAMLARSGRQVARAVRAALEGMD